MRSWCVNLNATILGMKRRRRLRRLIADDVLIRRRAAGESLRELAPDYDVAYTTLGRYFGRPEVKKQLKETQRQLRAERRQQTAGPRGGAPALTAYDWRPQSSAFPRPSRRAATKSRSRRGAPAAFAAAARQRGEMSDVHRPRRGCAPTCTPRTTRRRNESSPRVAAPRRCSTRQSFPRLRLPPSRSTRRSSFNLRQRRARARKAAPPGVDTGPSAAPPRRRYPAASTPRGG